MVVEGSSLLEGSFMNQDAGGVQWPRVQEAWKKVHRYLHLLSLFFLFAVFCHTFVTFLGVQELLLRLLDSCHFLKVTLVLYPPTFLPVFLPPIHSPLFLFKTFPSYQHLCIFFCTLIHLGTLKQR